MYKYNGENWYRDIRPLWMRLLMWVVHVAGWQMPHWTSAGYSYRWNTGAIRRAVRARGHRSRLFALYSSMCPISILGGRVVCYGFGINWLYRKTWYCLHRERDDGHTRWYAYRSRNATPWGADRWYFGAPHEVVAAAQAQADRMTADREARERRAKAVLN